MRRQEPNRFSNTLCRSNLIRMARLLLLFCFVSAGFPALYAQTVVQDFEEIPVFLVVQNVGGFEMNILYSDDIIYVPVSDLFKKLKINQTESPNADSVSGFMVMESNKYLINYSNKTITYKDKVYPIAEQGIIKSMPTLYLRGDYFGKIFGLNVVFNFRNLSLELKTDLELPIVKELRLEQMRKNINRLKGEIAVDTTIKRDYHLFRGGLADWMIFSNQRVNGRSDTRASLGLGAEIFGGEATALLNYSTLSGFDNRQQQYKWRWANNNTRLVKQVIAGKIPLKSISSIYAPVVGITATNTPTGFRKSFGSYLLTDYTEPGWTVELYINNVIVDYTTADASGFFSFDVPMVYGSTQLTLKFFGPWGEERIKEQTVNVPYNFLPQGSVEYNITGGVAQDTLHSTFARAQTSVGLHRNITMGAGVEHYSGIASASEIPFVNMSARFLNNFIFSGEYDHGVKGQALLNYRLPSSISLELEYINYDPNQKAISYNYYEERKVALSFPLKMGSQYIFSRASLKQNILKNLSYSSAEWLLTTYRNGMNINLSTTANWLSTGTPYIYSNLSLGFKLGPSTQFRPQAQFDFTNSNFISLRAEMEHKFNSNAYLGMVYEENLRAGFRSLELTFRYDLSFAKTQTSVRVSNQSVTTYQSARGSLLFGAGNKVRAGNESGAGRAGIMIIPFVDVNHNNKRDEGEPLAAGLNVKLNGGRILATDNDTIITVFELEPFTSYMLEVNDNSFENISWQIENKVLSIEIDPNQFKKVYIPVKVMGEVNGMVYISSNGGQKGQGRIVINIYDSDGKLIKQSLTEPDGYYNYLGLKPGTYTIQPDSRQLKQLQLKASPSSHEIEILPLSYGDIVDDQLFILETTKE